MDECKELFHHLTTVQVLEGDVIRGKKLFSVHMSQLGPHDVVIGILAEEPSELGKD